MVAHTSDVAVNLSSVAKWCTWNDHILHSWKVTLPQLTRYFTHYCVQRTQEDLR